MTSNEKGATDYVPEQFWEDRYSSLDLNRSGHRDLPEIYNRWLYRRKRAVLGRTLRRAGFPVDGARLLEIGVGTGAYVEFWQELGVAAVTGADLSRAAVDHLRERYPRHTFLKQDVTEPSAALELGCEEYDLVAALDVLYHVVDDARLETALGNAFRCLKPGGLLALHDQFLHRPSEDHGYIRWRSLADWQRLLDANGFEVLSRTPIFYVMIQPVDCMTEQGAARMRSLWVRTRSLIDRWPGCVGATACAVDTVLGAFVAEGPSMELMLARRKGRT